MKGLRMLTFSMLASTLWACSAEVPGLGGANPVSTARPGGSAIALSDESFDALSLDDQYRVINKLLSTLYNGVGVSDFYQMTASGSLSERSSSAPTLQSLRDRLGQPLSNSEREQYDQAVEASFNFDQQRPKQMPLARIFVYPISRDAYSQWMSWHLANTILFSPAEELDSANITDVQNLFRRLDLGIMQGSSIRSMVAAHQHSVENWRRFRSPEDNTREMMEIYLGIFDNDEEVPLASQACKDLYLTDERDGYKLAYTDYPNSEPVPVLGRYVTNCRDFYEVIASHPLLIPRIVSVLVDYFFTGHSTDERLAITEAISASNPVTFEHIFSAILFSENYLLDTERARSFEESFLPMAKRLQWKAHPDTFKGMISGRGSLSRANMSQMGWSGMTYKLGRVSSIPLDSLSFGNYHKALRESLMLDSGRWRVRLGVQSPGVPDPAPVESLPPDASARERSAHNEAVAAYDQALAQMSTAERESYDKDLAEYQNSLRLYTSVDDMTVSQLLDYLFLSAVQRRASAVERADLTRLLEMESHLDATFDNRFVRSGRLDDVTLIVMDYLSRLPELYFLSSIR